MAFRIPAEQALQGRNGSSLYELCFGLNAAFRQASVTLKREERFQNGKSSSI